MKGFFVMDIWTLVGIVSQGLFLLSFFIQWYSSEREGRSLIPNGFWHLRTGGAVLLLVYALARKDLVFLVTAVLQLVMYTRNIALEARKTADAG